MRNVEKIVDQTHSFSVRGSYTVYTVYIHCIYTVYIILGYKIHHSNVYILYTTLYAAFSLLCGSWFVQYIQYGIKVQTIIVRIMTRREREREQCILFIYCCILQYVLCTVYIILVYKIHHSTAVYISIYYEVSPDKKQVSGTENRSEKMQQCHSSAAAAATT